MQPNNVYTEKKPLVFRKIRLPPTTSTDVLRTAKVGAHAIFTDDESADEYDSNIFGRIIKRTEKIEPVTSWDPKNINVYLTLVVFKSSELEGILAAPTIFLGPVTFIKDKTL